MDVTRITLQAQVDTGLVAHFLGYPKEKTPPARILALMNELIPEGLRLASVRAAYRTIAFETAAQLGFVPAPADHLVIGVLTAGKGIEHRASELLGRKQITAALIMEAVGSAVAEQAADSLSELIATALSGGGVPEYDAVAPPTYRISPGYGHWPLSAQAALLGLLPIADLGLSLNSGYLMLPRKSISFALHVNPRDVSLCSNSKCASCQLERCLYRDDPRDTH